MNIRTMIIEDDPMVSNINKTFLERMEAFELVAIAKNGEAALKLLKNDEIDLLLMDVYMPNLNGIDLLRTVRSQGYKCDVIMITAADSTDIVEEAFRLGVVDFILKPYDFQRFQTALQLTKKRFALFRGAESLNQQKIDSLQLLMDREESAPLPKGIDPITLELIREALHGSNSPLSAQNISDQVELSRITTRKYLEYMVEINEIKLELKYSQQGRPTKLYRYLSRPKSE